MLIISDIHFGTDNKKEVAEFLKIAKDERFNPQKLVVIPGDLTSHHFNLRRDKEELYYAEKLIKDLVSNNIRVILTLGNHDVGCISGAIPINFDAKKKFKKIFDKYIYSQKNVKILGTKGFDSIIMVDKEIFVSLKSVQGISRNPLMLPNFDNYSKRIKKSQIEWASNILIDFRKQNKLEKFRLHFVTHISMWQGCHSPMLQRKRLENGLLKKFNFYSFIHGHNHEFICAKRSTPKIGKDIIQLSAPTLAPGRSRSSKAGYVSWENLDTFARFIDLEEMNKNYLSCYKTDPEIELEQVEINDYADESDYENNESEYFDDED